MSLTIVLGPMFSGKSSYLLSSIRKYKELNLPIFIITSVLDKRYTTDTKIVSHNQEFAVADASVKNLEVVNDTKEYLDAKLIIIEEAQFFPDLVKFVLEAVEVYDKHVIVAGLDGDADRKPFGSLLELIPYADTIIKLKALCKKCNDGTEALFTSKKVQNLNNSVINIGSSDKYEALCRKHYVAYN
jgi:thymidine kinase